MSMVGRTVRVREGGRIERDDYDRAGIVNSYYHGDHKNGDWQHVVTFEDDGTPVIRELPWCHGDGFEEYDDDKYTPNFCWDYI